MAIGPMGDRARAAQIAALALNRGETPDQIAFRLADYGIPLDSPEMAQALQDAAESVRLAVAIQVGDEANAQTIMTQMRADGLDTVILSAAARFQIPAVPETGAPAQTVYREVQIELPTTATAAESLAMLEAIGMQMAAEGGGPSGIAVGEFQAVEMRSAIGR